MITDWLTAIGTIAVAIIAVFQDHIRSWLVRPRLDVFIKPSPPDCIKTVVKHESMLRFSADCYYFRLHVKNIGNQRAENVEVYASRLLKQQADGRYSVMDSFLPMNLLWANVRKPFIEAISPGMEKLCDLAHIIDPAKRDIYNEENQGLNITNLQTSMTFDTAVVPFTKGNIISPGKYHIELLIGAGNCMPVKKLVEITITGLWSSDTQTMLRDGVGVQIL